MPTLAHLHIGRLFDVAEVAQQFDKGRAGLAGLDEKALVNALLGPFRAIMRIALSLVFT